MKAATRIASLLLATALAACTTAPPVPLPATPTPASMQWYQDAARAGKRVWQIDSKASLIVVTVRRGGALARLGHDHVVASHAVQGLVAPDDGRADFHFQLDQLQVDERDLRAEAGLTTEPSAEAIDGTRNNMLTRVLDAQRYPVVTLSVARMAGSDSTLRLRIGLHGVERTVEVPTRIDSGPTGLVATGHFTLLQSDFGITPMSVLGGAMTVQDQMELRFRLVARQP